MRIGVITYAFHLAEPLDALLKHILVETDARLYLFLHSQDSGVRAVCESWTRPLAFQWQDRVCYYPYGVNRGLALSVNDALIDGYERDGCDVMITMNDDCMPRPGDLERIAALAIARPDAYLVEGYGRVGAREEALDTACAAITKRAIEVIGYFDENCYPAYYEDCDYHRRALLAGLPRLVATDTCITHQGSASLKTVSEEQHHRQFLALRAYYIQKWGRDKLQEDYTVPFNDPKYGLKIEAADRHNPYPEYARG